jgi:hypothetical protein
MATVRTLYNWEVQLFVPIFENTLRYGDIRIHEGTTFPDQIDRLGRRLKGMPPPDANLHNAVTLGNHLYFPVKLLSELAPAGHAEGYKLDWLAHELTHAWQYQHQSWLYLVRALRAQFKEKDKAYDYGGEAGLIASRANNKSFFDFNPEQQGNIVQDYFRKQRANLDASAFAPFISDLQTARFSY